MSRTFARISETYIMYLHKNVSTFMSISLMYNNYYAQFVSVHFLIQENVTLGLTFAVCHKRDSKSIFFANYNPYIWYHKSYCYDHSRPLGIEQLRLRKSRNARFKHSSITISQNRKSTDKNYEKIILTVKHGMNVFFFVLFCVVKINT